jgi:hypothetical protein
LLAACMQEMHLQAESTSRVSSVLPETVGEGCFPAKKVRASNQRSKRHRRAGRKRRRNRRLIYLGGKPSLGVRRPWLQALPSVAKILRPEQAAAVEPTKCGERQTELDYDLLTSNEMPTQTYQSAHRHHQSDPRLPIGACRCRAARLALPAR